MILHLFAPTPAEARGFVKWRLAFFAIMHGLALLSFWHFSTAGVALAFALYLLSGGLGISLGYHRYFCHKAFQAGPFLENIMMLAGSLAFLGGPISWVAWHRAHHRFENRPGDPHARNRGFVWSHFGWSLFAGANQYSRRKELADLSHISHKPLAIWLEKYHLHLNLIIFGIAALILPWDIFLMGFPLRIVIIWHITWLINSLAHDNDTEGESARNIPFLALISFGEGLHLNHHRSPANANFSNKRNQIDLGYSIIRLLKITRLAEEVHDTPSANLR